jgi:hypothetical protein
MVPTTVLNIQKLLPYENMDSISWVIFFSYEAEVWVPGRQSKSKAPNLIFHEFGKVFQKKLNAQELTLY